MSWEWIWLEQVPVPFYPNTAVRFLIALDTNLIEFDHDHMDHITQAGINLLTPYSCWKKISYTVCPLSFLIGCLSIGLLEDKYSISIAVTYGHAHTTYRDKNSEDKTFVGCEMSASVFCATLHACNAQKWHLLCIWLAIFVEECGL